MIALGLAMLLLSACQGSMNASLDTPLGQGNLDLGGALDGNNDSESGNSSQPAAPVNGLQWNDPLVIIILTILGMLILAAIITYR
jgi:hypothetical protein